MKYKVINVKYKCKNNGLEDICNRSLFVVYLTITKIMIYSREYWLCVICHYIHDTIFIVYIHIMATVVEKVEKYAAKCAELGMNIPGWLLTRAAKACGPALFNADAETVAASDVTELETVRDNFVMGKLKVEDADEAMNIVNQVAEEMSEFGSSKWRAVFYARCAEIAGKEDMLPEAKIIDMNWDKEMQQAA